MTTSKLSEAARQLTYRAVHLKIYPQPSLAESRQVLRILQGYGEVYMYRNLAYDYPSPAPNAILAIYKNPESASRLIQDSPLNFTVEPHLPGPHNAKYPKFLFTDTSNSNIKSSQTIAADSRPKQFMLKADISTKDHQGHIARQHYYGGFRIKERSAVVLDLRTAVPVPGMAQFAKSDPEKSQRYIRAELDKIAQRKNLRQLLEEGLNVVDKPQQKRANIPSSSVEENSTDDLDSLLSESGPSRRPSR